jgi:hypothetical protein
MERIRVEVSIADLCRRGGIHSIVYSDAKREAASDELAKIRCENERLKRSPPRAATFNLTGHNSVIAFVDTQFRNWSKGNDTLEDLSAIAGDATFSILSVHIEDNQKLKYSHCSVDDGTLLGLEKTSVQQNITQIQNTQLYSAK